MTGKISIKNPSRPEKSLAWMVVAAIAALTAPAHAAIPSGQTIAARVARGHGKNAYVIEQDVQFRTNAEPLVLRERWLIDNGDRMRVSISTVPGGGAKPGENARFEILYRDGKRFSTDLKSAQVKSAPVNTEFAEPAFHARSAKGFLNALVRNRVLPIDVLRDKQKPTKLDQIRYVPEPLLRLGRDAGSVAWIFGEPSPAEGKLTAQAWVEQDIFNLRRLRFPTEAELVADRYSAYPNGLRLPRERTLTWGDNIVTIRIVSVRATASAQISKALEPNDFSTNAKAAMLPDLAQVREFYSRFR